ncbi:MAG: hypothetical protein K8S25_06020, partial [Alphaproteobacteria bacterium]|nr:hypothetical protein [Alphaproteobacteria bacterium]
MITWREEDFTDASEIAALSKCAKDAFPCLEMGQDLEWLNALWSTPDKSLLVLSAWLDDRLAGLAIFKVNSASLQFALGEITFLRKRIRRFALEGNPLIADTLPASAIGDCFTTLAERLPKNAAVFLAGIPHSSAFHVELHDKNSALRSRFFVVPHGPTYLRCRIRWDGSFENYL